MSTGACCEACARATSPAVRPGGQARGSAKEIVAAGAVGPGGRGYRRFLLGPSGVAGVFELVGQLRSPAHHDPPTRQHMGVIGPQLGQQAGVVGDGKHAEVGFSGSRLNPAGDGAQGVDVQAESISSSTRTSAKDAELDRLVPLPLPPDRSTLSAPGMEALVEADPGRLRGHQLRNLGGLSATGPKRFGQRLLERHSGHLDRVLHPEKQAGLGPFPRRQSQDVRPVEGDPTGGHDVTRPAEQDVGEGALARAVRAHHRVHLARADGQVHSAQDLPAGDLRRQPGDDQLMGHASLTTTSLPSRRTW